MREEHRLLGAAAIGVTIYEYGEIVDSVDQARKDYEKGIQNVEEDGGEAACKAKNDEVQGLEDGARWGVETEAELIETATGAQAGKLPKKLEKIIQVKDRAGAAQKVLKAMMEALAKCAQRNGGIVACLERGFLPDPPKRPERPKTPEPAPKDPGDHGGGDGVEPGGGKDRTHPSDNDLRMLGR